MWVLLLMCACVLCAVGQQTFLNTYSYNTTSCSFGSLVAVRSNRTACTRAAGPCVNGLVVSCESIRPQLLALTVSKVCCQRVLCGTVAATCASLQCPTYSPRGTRAVLRVKLQWRSGHLRVVRGQHVLQHAEWRVRVGAVPGQSHSRGPLPRARLLGRQVQLDTGARRRVWFWFLRVFPLTLIDALRLASGGHGMHQRCGRRRVDAGQQLPGLVPELLVCRRRMGRRQHRPHLVRRPLYVAHLHTFHLFAFVSLLYPSPGSGDCVCYLGHSQDARASRPCPVAALAGAHPHWRHGVHGSQSHQEWAA